MNVISPITDISSRLSPIRLICLVLTTVMSMMPVDMLADEVHRPSEWLSGSLPVLYINTADATPITSRVDYIDATYWLDAKGFDEYESIGSAEAPLPLSIKGRGNTTWNAAKKPYRIKLGKKASLLGMNKNKHWCLMAEVSGIFIADALAFEYSRRLKMPWTPEMRPVEFVLNGDYKGLYFITEKIGIDADRINIVEQNDREENPFNVTGGWLMEIDNTSDEQQIVFNDRTDGSKLRFTWHEPDTLSPIQHDYILTLLTTVDSLIYVPDKTSTEWERYIDIEALARFYIVNELMDNCESFSGSCFFYKDRGEGTKFIFGPCWDAGSCFAHYAIGMRDFIYNQTPGYSHMHWIGEIAKFPHFQRVVQRIWSQEVISDNTCDQNEIAAFIDRLCATVAKAAEKDVYRWGGTLGVWDVSRKASTFKHYAKKKYDFLSEVWDYHDAVEDLHATGTATTDQWHTMQGQRIDEPQQPGIYIHNGKKVLLGR